MNEHDMERWHNLVAMSAPSFAGDMTPPYGFMTKTLADLRAENRQLAVAERIGLRALFAALAVLFATAALTFGMAHLSRSDPEPGLRTIVLVENVPIS
jgi:hypothetical protein